MVRRGSDVIATGARVHLRALRDRDRDEFIRVARTSRRLHRPWVSPPCDAAAFRRWMRDSRSRSRARFVICSNGDASITGYLALNQIVRGTLKSAYLGYWAARGWERQGLLTEGLGLGLRHAFQVLRLHRVEANIQPENRPSIALASRCGFRLEGFSPRYLKVGGRWRDHERWAITIEDWRAGLRRPRTRRSSLSREAP